MLEDFSSNAKDNATYSASAEDIAVQFCFFDIQLTSLSPRNCILQKCFFEYQGIRHDQRLKMLLVQSQNPLDTRKSLRHQGKFDSSSYRLLELAFNLIQSFLRRRLFLDDLDQRTLPAEQRKPLPSLSRSNWMQMILQNQLPSFSELSSSKQVCFGANYRSDLHPSCSSLTTLAFIIISLPIDSAHCLLNVLLVQLYFLESDHTHFRICGKLSSGLNWRWMDFHELVYMVDLWSSGIMTFRDVVGCNILQVKGKNILSWFGHGVRVVIILTPFVLEVRGLNRFQKTSLVVEALKMIWKLRAESIVRASSTRVLFLSFDTPFCSGVRGVDV
ncbi:hypothetical protein Tco_0034000 [Tanacetum coccineum]